MRATRWRWWGVDPEAEQYWMDAIFDTSLPDNEREDLMEDLNEVGFDDLKNLTPDDVALIERRLQILQDNRASRRSFHDAASFGAL